MAARRLAVRVRGAAILLVTAAGATVVGVPVQILGARLMGASAGALQLWVELGRLWALEVAVPLVIACLLWPLLRWWWIRAMAVLTLCAGVGHAAALAWMEFHAGQVQPDIIVLARTVLGDVGLMAVGILVPAANLALLAAATLVLGVGLTWPRRAVLAVGVTIVASLLEAAWGMASVAANTDGLGSLQPTLAAMLQVLHWSSVTSTLALVIASSSLVGMARAIERRLR